MNTTTKSLPELVQELPPSDQTKVRDFVEFLMAKRQPKTEKKLRQDWAGILREYRKEYTALELQKKALEWRDEA